MPLSNAQSMQSLMDSRAWADIHADLKDAEEQSMERLVTQNLPDHETHFLRGFIAALRVAMQLPQVMKDELSGDADKT